MKLYVTAAQRQILADLLNERIMAIHRQVGCGRAGKPRGGSARDQRRRESELLEGLQEQLFEATRAEQTKAAWEGYVEARKNVPSNPPPGSH